MKQDLVINGVLHTIEILSQSHDTIEFIYQGNRYRYTLRQHYHSHFIVGNDQGLLARGAIQKNVITLDGYDLHIHANHRGASAGKTDTQERLPIAPMPGMIQAILVNVSDKVIKDQPLVVMEAMKMQLTIKAAHDGVIEAVHVKVGDAVAKGAMLVTLNESA